MAATRPSTVYSAASAAGRWPNSRSVPEVNGLMLASLARRKSSPKRPASERAIAELVTVIQSIRPARSRAATVRVRFLHVGAGIDDDLLHRGAGGRELLGQDLAAAAGPDQQESSARGLVCQRLGQRFGTILPGHEVGTQPVSRELVGGARPNRRQFARGKGRSYLLFGDWCDFRRLLTASQIPPIATGGASRRHESSRSRTGCVPVSRSRSSR